MAPFDIKFHACKESILSLRGRATVGLTCAITAVARRAGLTLHTPSALPCNLKDRFLFLGLGGRMATLGLKPLRKKRTFSSLRRDVLQAGWAITREAAASLLTYELYPLGVPTGSMPVLTFPQIRLPHTKPEVPVLFIHGLLHNPSTFAWLKQKLALYGFKNFSDMNLSTMTHGIDEMSEQTAGSVEQILKRYQVPHIDIVAHSMGGLVARHFVQKLGGDGKVRNLITLGTPHQGTRISNYFWFENIKSLSPDSPTILELNACPLPQHTRAVAVSGGMDVLMWPRTCVQWEGVRNIHLPRVGHAGLLFSRRVLQIIVAHLHPQLLWTGEPQP
jgi:triacylglycerol lipase